MKKRLFLFSLFFIGHSLSIIAQQIEPFGITQGLTSNFVYDVHQSRKGFLYLGLSEGLNRYDGYTVEHFKHNPFDPFSIKKGVVRAIAEDNRGYIWLSIGYGNNSGGFIDVFNPQTQRFHHLGQLNEWLNMDRKIGSRAIMTDKNGDIWLLGGKDEFFKIDLPTDFTLEDKTASINSFAAYQIQIPNKGKKPTGIVNALLDSQDNLWAFGSNGTIVWIDKNNNEPRIIFQPQQKIKVNQYTPFFEDADGTLKFRVGQQWHQIKNKQVQAIQVHSWFQNAIFFGVDKEQNYVYSIFNPTKKQIYFYQSPVQSLIAEQPIFKHFYSLPRFVGTRLFIDNAGTFWIKDRFGVSKVNPNPKKFRHLLKGKSVHQLITDSQGKVFLQKNSRIIPSLADTTNSYIPLSSVYPALDFKVQFILIDRQDQIFGRKKLLAKTSKIPTAKHRFPYFHFDPATQTLQEFAFNGIPKFNRIAAETVDKKNRTWLASAREGLFLIELNQKKATLFQDENFPLPLSSDFIYCDLYVDIDNQLWIATDAGIFRTNSNDFPQQPPKWERITNDPTNKNSLNSNAILCLLEDPNKPEEFIWVGTAGGGLNKLNKQTGFCRHFTTASSDIPNDNVLQMQSDSLGRIWMSTKRGLSKFDPQKENFVNYTPDDGLQSFEFNFSSTKLPTGTLLFGGFDGLTVFNPNEKTFEDVPFTNKTQITQLYVNHKKVQIHKKAEETNFQLSHAIEYTESLNLAHHQNNVQLHFSTTELTAPNKNHFQYRFTKDHTFGGPTDTNWIGLGTENKVSFNNLSPATYLFEVKGANQHNVWNETPTTLSITVRPPWWQANIAYFAYLLTFLGVIYAIYKNQIHRAKLANDLIFEQKEAQRLAELDRIKTNFFSNITHEFRTPLTLILEPLRQVLKKDLNGEITKSLHLAKNNSEKLLQLVNQLLDISKLEAGKMELDLRKGNVLDIIQPIVDSFKILATRKGLTLEMTLTQNIDEFYFDKKHLEKIVYNLLANAVKFTEKGGITINISNASNSELAFSPSGGMSELSLKGENRYGKKGEEKREVNQTISPPNPLQRGEIEFYFKISVKDTGIGIPQNQLSHIFERFYQADSSNTRKGEGTGIGLALTRELVELMEGSISVVSKVGEGSTFTFQLPMLQSAVGSSQLGVVVAVNNSSSSSPQPATSNQQLTTAPNSSFIVHHPSLTILLIEDNAELRHFLKASLEIAYNMLEAENGEVGIELAKKHIPDLIICDVMMPIKDGFEVVVALKNDLKTSHIPIILLTAKTAIDSKLKGLRGGADDYLTKPFNTEELQVRIANLIAIRQQLQIKFSNTLTHKISDTPTEILCKIDQDFLENLQQLMEANLENETLSVEILAQKVFMSRTHLFRKVKALTNLTPTEFIRNYRLDRAMEYLQQKEHNVIQVSMMVGFNSEKYFSRRFKERFGQSPSEV